MKPIIEVKNLGKEYQLGANSAGYLSVRDSFTNLFKKSQKVDKTFWALDGLDFEVYPGDTVGIIGRNGAGKSTLLKILSKITPPTTGSIKLRGRVASLLEVGTGFHPELSGRENIYMNGSILGMRKWEIAKKFDEIVDFAGVEKFLDNPVKHYSSGMYVRLAFAVAAHLEPEILIVDEVLAVGDAEFQKKCLGKMDSVTKNEGRTVLFVSHQMGAVAQLCKQGVLLENGRLKEIGMCKKILESYIYNLQNQGHEYILNENIGSKSPNYFTRIYTSNTKDEIITSYSFDQEIKVNFEFVENIKSSNLQIGIALCNISQSRVFTVLKPTDFFGLDKIRKGSVKLPSGLFAPGKYSFTFAIFEQNGNISDLLESQCFIDIVDNGTDYSMYEGIDYGNVIITPSWTKIS